MLPHGTQIADDHTSPQGHQLHWRLISICSSRLWSCERSNRGWHCLTQFPQPLTTSASNSQQPLSLWELVCLQGRPERPFQSSPWPVTGSMGDINIPVPSPWWGHSEMWLHCLQSSLKGPAKVSHHGTWHWALGWSPSLPFPTFPTLRMFPGIISESIAFMAIIALGLLLAVNWEGQRNMILDPSKLPPLWII